MSDNDSSSKNIQSHLRELSGIKTVSQVKISNNIIRYINIKTTTLGELTLERVIVEDSLKLFNFYFHGLSETARIFFCPYPIFNPRPKSPEELSDTIKDWEREDDWVLLKLSKDTQIIGICLLKKYKTKLPTSGLAVREKFQKMGLGILLQTIINEQAQLLQLKKLTITLAQNNVASLKVHEKTGYKKTGRLVPHFTYIEGVKKIDRVDIEMIKEFI